MLSVNPNTLENRSFCSNSNSTLFDWIQTPFGRIYCTTYIRNNFSQLKDKLILNWSENLNISKEIPISKIISIALRWMESGMKWKTCRARCEITLYVGNLSITIQVRKSLQPFQNTYGKLIRISHDAKYNSDQIGHKIT